MGENLSWVFCGLGSCVEYKRGKGGNSHQAAAFLLCFSVCQEMDKILLLLPSATLITPQGLSQNESFLLKVMGRNKPDRVL